MSTLRSCFPPVLLAGLTLACTSAPASRPYRCVDARPVIASFATPSPTPSYEVDAEPDAQAEAAPVTVSATAATTFLSPMEVDEVVEPQEISEPTDTDEATPEDAPAALSQATNLDRPGAE